MPCMGTCSRAIGETGGASTRTLLSAHVRSVGAMHAYFWGGIALAKQLVDHGRLIPSDPAAWVLFSLSPLE